MYSTCGVFPVPPTVIFPIEITGTSNSFDFKTGLRAIKPGDNANEKIFQIDNEWQQYRHAKMIARAERLDKYVCSHQLGPATESRATLYIVNQLTHEHPEQFELTQSRNNIRLHCRLSGEQLDFDQSLQLINNHERRHFSRNPTGRPSRPRERKIGDD